MTSAEPYSSTNWRFALSSVLGFRSATVAFIAQSPQSPKRALSSRQAIHSVPLTRPKRMTMPMRDEVDVPEALAHRLREARGGDRERSGIALACLSLSHRSRRIRGTDEIMLWPP